jgi:hypothetical protein
MIALSFCKYSSEFCRMKRQQRSTTRQLYDAVRREFHKYSEMKENGVQKYSTEWIIMKVGEKFFRAPRTIENIVFHRTNDEKPGYVQINLFEAT